jgi:hypothetical protein
MPIVIGTPPVITPDSPLVVRGLHSQAFESDINVSWAASGGQIYSFGPKSLTWIAPNRAGTYQITATPQDDGPATVTTVTVEAEWIYDPSEGSDGATRKKVFASEAISRARQLRAKSGARRFYNLTFTEREEIELTEAEAFFNWHNLQALPFYWTNKTLGQERRFIFETATIDWTAQSFNAFDYQLGLRELDAVRHWPEGTELATFPYVPDYAYEAKSGLPASRSDAPAGQRVSRADGGGGRSYILKFDSRSASEFLSAEDFWNLHYPGRCFYFTDPLRPSISGVYEFDGDITHRDLRGPNLDYTLLIREHVGSSPLGAILLSALPPPFEPGGDGV